MKVNKFVKPKNSTINYHKNLLLLQNFDEYFLMITLNNCGDRNAYHISYKKFDKNISLPLYFVIPTFYGRVYERNDENYLNICGVDENSSTLSDYKKLIVAVLKEINKLNGTKYEFVEDYYQIKLGDSAENMRVGDLLKISFAVVSFNVIVEKDGVLMSYLKECFYENLSKEIINNEFEIIESEK